MDVLHIITTSQTKAFFRAFLYLAAPGAPYGGTPSTFFTLSGALTYSGSIPPTALSTTAYTACRMATYVTELSATKNSAHAHTPPTVGDAVDPTFAAIWSSNPNICVTNSFITFSRSTSEENARLAKIPRTAPPPRLGR